MFIFSLRNKFITEGLSVDRSAAQGRTIHCCVLIDWAVASRTHSLSHHGRRTRESERWNKKQTGGSGACIQFAALDVCACGAKFHPQIFSGRSHDWIIQYGAGPKRDFPSPARHDASEREKSFSSSSSLALYLCERRRRRWPHPCTAITLSCLGHQSNLPVSALTALRTVPLLDLARAEREREREPWLIPSRPAPTRSLPAQRKKREPLQRLGRQPR